MSPLVITLLLAFTLCCAGPGVANRLVFTNVQRTIDLKRQLVKTDYAVSMQNTGAEDVVEVLWAADTNSSGRLAFIEASDAADRELHVAKSTLNAECYVIKLSTPLGTGKSASVSVSEVYWGRLLPFPRFIKQNDVQLVVYEGNGFVSALYEVKRQTTVVNLATSHVESYSENRPVAVYNKKLIYGPYESQQPFAFQALVIHYENNAPFMTVKEARRNIEVSHWGTITVQENIHLVHTGARLKGAFSRIDYQRSALNARSSVRSLVMTLPASAENVECKDNIGLLWSHGVTNKENLVLLELFPRYPLFGSWQTKFTVTYTVPAYEYLFYDPSRASYTLNIRLVDHIFNDMHVEHLQTKILVPANAMEVHLKTPYPVDRLPDSYAGRSGRPAVTVAKDHLVENHIQDLELTYEWPVVMFLYEPALLVIFLYVLFLSVIIYIRMDFSIERDVKGCS